MFGTLAELHCLHLSWRPSCLLSGGKWTIPQRVTSLPVLLHGSSLMAVPEAESTTNSSLIEMLSWYPTIVSHPTTSACVNNSSRSCAHHVSRSSTDVFAVRICTARQATTPPKTNDTLIGNRFIV